VAALIVGVGLSILGYTPNESQSLVTINGLRIMIIIAPLLFVCSTYPFDKSDSVFKYTIPYTV
ncbi:melibiose:sodium transporter MelB, partial [Staphylococcus saprophyticus]